VITPNDESVSVTTRLLGKHNVHNILMGFAVGTHFGLRPETLALAAGRIEPVEHRLELKSAGPYTIIDDAFNSNPVGARNAVDVLASFTGGRRVLVTPGMVELGDREVAENRAFGVHIGHSGIEQVVLVGPKQTQPIRDGLQEAGYPEAQVYVARNLFEANDWLRGWLQDGDFVLYENDLPDTYAE
jgi:UDP-N-acetylmuramoyl-tripeptide--D-alanyl-D-alanine ligase